ncbi:MAG: hypothetical protein ACOVRN_01710 [Flavobacterium sp.]
MGKTAKLLKGLRLPDLTRRNKPLKNKNKSNEKRSKSDSPGRKLRKTVKNYQSHQVDVEQLAKKVDKLDNDIATVFSKKGKAKKKASSNSGNIVLTVRNLDTGKIAKATVIKNLDTGKYELHQLPESK